MSIPTWLLEIIEWFFKTFGQDLLIVAKERLKQEWQRTFTSRNILILGAKQTGKSSLVLYLMKGKPYEMVGRERRAPNPTAMAAIIDHKFKVKTGDWLKIKEDHPGDVGLRKWAQAIQDIQPHGIIYMIDGRRNQSEITEDIREVFTDVLCHYERGTEELGALHIFVNFADKWVTSPQAERELVSRVVAKFEQERGTRPKLQAIRFSACATQLSMHEDKWDETRRAVHHFAADLKA